MAYKLKLDATIEQSIKHAATEQLKKAINHLSAQKTPTLGVHETRKNLKRTRALLRLIQPVIEKTHFQKANITLRDIARSLSGTRDIQAMIETILKLQTHFTLNTEDLIILPLIQLLQKNKKTAEKKIKKFSQKTILKDLQDANLFFENLNFEKESIDCILPGLQNIYDKGMQQMHIAYSECSIDAFHEWRKFLQYHWRHTQFISPIWPEFFEIKITQTAAVSEILGIHNDLSNLIDFLNENKTKFDDKNQMKEFINLCDQWRKEQRHAAQKPGLRIYAETPKAYNACIKKYWEAL